ncbi:hypothetical protein [Marinicella meishanensis]|uniref:hypothetical protein n=1 Tax=Marinicella meishanensis TaxID=2873263 RepID=UPI001CBBBF0D|nr:hypothetical protein [Marinicella sp. NBU2979]
MKFSPTELAETHQAMTQQASPIGAIVGALMGAVPAIAIYAFFVHMGAILYVFIMIPPAIIGLAAQFTGQVHAIKHRLAVGLIASVVHLACLYYFNYRLLYYFLVPIIFVVAVAVAKKRLSRIEQLVADMEAEGRFDQT